MILSSTTRRYGLWLTAAVLVLGLGHVFLHAFEAPLEARYGRHITRWLDMNQETSVATWFSVGLLQIAGVVAVVAAVAAHQARTRMAWASLAVALFLLSLDDKISIHEALPDLLGMTRGSLLSHEWLIPGIIIAAVAFVALVLLLRPLPRAVKMGLLIAAAVFGAGAVGIEFLSGMFIRVLPSDHALVRLLPLWELLEESLEKLGTVIAFLVILRHLERTGVYDPVRWHRQSAQWENERSDRGGLR